MQLQDSFCCLLVHFRFGLQKTAQRRESHLILTVHFDLDEVRFVVPQGQIIASDFYIHGIIERGAAVDKDLGARNQAHIP